MAGRSMPAEIIRNWAPRQADGDEGYDRAIFMLRTVTAAALGAILIGGCGRSTVVGADRTLAVGLSEYRMIPAEVRMSEGLVTIVVHNYGRLSHNLTVSLDGETEGSTDPLAPGQTAELPLELMPGTYVLASTLLDDQSLGQYGTLTVTR